MIQCEGRGGSCFRRVRMPTGNAVPLCTQCWMARHDLEVAEQCADYPECPACGADADQQCSIVDDDGASVELSNFVHWQRAK